MTLKESDIKKLIKEEISKLITTGQKKKKDMNDIIESYGIVNQIQLSLPGTGIGYSPTSQKWYGWSGDAIYGFSVGSSMSKNDCGTKFCKIKKARTLEDARQMAIAFATESYQENQIAG